MSVREINKMREVWHTEAEESAKKDSRNQQSNAYCELAVFPDGWDERIANGTLPGLVQ